MTKRMQDDEFEALLGRALRVEAAPAGIAERLGAGPRRGTWFMALLSPSRMAASAAYNVEKRNGHPLTEDEFLAVLSREVKTRR